MTIIQPNFQRPKKQKTPATFFSEGCRGFLSSPILY
jgi:hypothetical protein